MPASVICLERPTRHQCEHEAKAESPQSLTYLVNVQLQGGLSRFQVRKEVGPGKVRTGVDGGGGELSDGGGEGSAVGASDLGRRRNVHGVHRTACSKWNAENVKIVHAGNTAALWHSTCQ